MLLDSNIFIYASQPQNTFLKKYFSRLYFTSELSKVEVLGYHKISLPEIVFFELSFTAVTIIAVNTTIIEEAIKIRQQKPISTADAIIAATALKNNLALITRNEADFKLIPGLQVINPFTI